MTPLKAGRAVVMPIKTPIQGPVINQDSDTQLGPGTGVSFHLEPRSHCIDNKLKYLNIKRHHHQPFLTPRHSGDSKAGGPWPKELCG